MSKHSGGGLLLVFVRTDAYQWQELIFPFAHSVLFIKGRIKFRNGDGKPGTSQAAMPSALVAYSEADTEALRNSGIKGKLVILK